MRRLTALAFALVVLLTAVSAFIRLSQAGLGCSPWPGCYALLGDAPQTFPVAALLHRLSASTLGILVLLINVGAWRRGEQRTLATATLLITLLLAALGVRSGGLSVPAVVLGNFSGGLLLTVLLGSLLVGSRGHATPAHPAWPVLLIAVLLGTATIATGIASSAFYGNAGCSGWWCGTAQPLGTLEPFAPLGLDATGHVVITGAAAALQGVHRLSGLAMVMAFAILTFAARRTPRRELAIAGLCLAAATAAVGLAASQLNVPISLAVVHSLAGAFLLLLLLAVWRRA